jgi:hypothetical protein
MAVVGIAIASFSAVSVLPSVFAVTTTFSLPACNVAESEGGATCAAVTPNKGDGVTTCGDSTCAAGMYCVVDGGDNCASGCTSTSQCPYGNYCDLTNPTPDLEGNLFGTCTQPTLQQQAPCADASTTTDAGSAADAGH